MTLEEFDRFWEKMCEKEHELLSSKGVDYSGEENRFRNFNKIGEELNLHPVFVAYVYFKKHLDSIATYISKMSDRKYQPSEPIIGRFHDARNYLALIAGMIEEDKSTQK